MAEDHLIYITEKDLLATIITNPDHQGDGVEVLDGGTAHLDADHVHHLEENEKETGIEIEIETGVGIEIATGTGTRTGILIGREEEETIGTVRRGVMAFQCQRRRL